MIRIRKKTSTTDLGGGKFVVFTCRHWNCIVSKMQYIVMMRDMVAKGHKMISRVWRLANRPMGHSKLSFFESLVLKRMNFNNSRANTMFVIIGTGMPMNQ